MSKKKKRKPKKDFMGFDITYPISDDGWRWKK